MPACLAGMGRHSLPVARKGKSMAERRRVLVVDDNRDTTDLLCQSLEEHGYTAIPAYDGVEAIRKARNDVLDCVLLDIMMPEYSGLKVCYELKRQDATKHLPVVILSAKKDPKDVSYAKQMGADDYLTKPVKLRKLLESLEKHALRNRPGESVLPGQSILFVGGDQSLVDATQKILDAGRVGGSEWLRLVPVPGCEQVEAAIAEGVPRAMVIDSRVGVRAAAALCRQFKLNPAAKQVVVIVLLENAADDVKFAWANECLLEPFEPVKLAETLKKHLKR